MQVSRSLLVPFLLCAFLPTFAHADMPPEPVISVATDDSSGTSFLDIVRTDEGTLKALSYRGQDGAIRTVLITDLDQGDQPLKIVGNRKVIMLSKEADLNPAKGGHVLVKFLYNGATNCYLDFRIQIQVQDKVIFFSDPDSNDPHTDHNPYTALFNHLFMKKRMVLGKEIGIKDVEPSWIYERTSH
jgi:hypothetical protein